MKPRSAAVATATLVVLAGCGGYLGGGGDRPTETVTPVPVPTPEPSYPPGLTGERIENALLLADTHVSRIANHSYTYRAVTIYRSNGSVIGRVRVLQRVGRGHWPFNYTQRVSGNLTSPRLIPVSFPELQAYSNGTRTFIRITTGNRTRYLRQEVGHAPVLHSVADKKSFVFRWFSVVQMRSIRRVEVADGEVLYQIRARASNVTFGYREMTDVRLFAQVTPGGLVRFLRVSYDVRIGNWTGHVVRAVKYSGIGSTTVERPAWIGTATDDASSGNESPPARLGTPNDGKPGDVGGRSHPTAERNSQYFGAATVR